MPSRWGVLLGAAALAYLVLAVFYPILRFPFIDLDVPKQVIDNPYIRSLSWENLKHIFTKPCITSYYPVRTLSFALDYQLWGLEAGGFKLTNLLLHLANVFDDVLFRLFRDHSHAIEDETVLGEDKEVDVFPSYHFDCASDRGIGQHRRALLGQFDKKDPRDGEGRPTSRRTPQASQTPRRRQYCAGGHPQPSVHAAHRGDLHGTASSSAAEASGLSPWPLRIDAINRLVL